jgi:hypothetical protein
MITNGDLSALTITSSIVNVINLDTASIHVYWNGTSPVGVITVEARNGESNSWYNLDFGSTISVSGNSGNHQIVFTEMPFTDIRLVYTRSSGSGTLNAIITMKTTGA